MAKPTLQKAFASLGAALDAAVDSFRKAVAQTSSARARPAPPAKRRRAAARKGARRGPRGTGPLGTKAQALILAALRKAKGPITSGDLSRRTKVAKTSIAKHVTALKKKGAKIRSAPRRGYELMTRAARAAQKAVSKGKARKTSKTRKVRKVRKVARRRGGSGERGLRARELVLGSLRSSKKPLTGAVLAKRAGVSKMTIGRQIEALRKQGRKIRGTRGLGYELVRR